MKDRKFKQTEIGEIPEDWEVKRIGEVFELSQGLQIAKKLRFSNPEIGAIPLLKITEFPTGNFTEYVKDIEPQHLANAEDIIYTRTGQVGLVYTGYVGCVHNNCFKVHYDKTKFDKLFVYYMLKQKRVFLYSNSVAAGSVQKDLNHPAFKSCIIAFPKLPEQMEIAKILSDLDAQIEILQQQNETLEAIGRTIFKHWFVDFEFPKEENRPYKSSGGEMVDSELGKIPKDWSITKMSQLVIIERKGVDPRMHANEVFAHYSFGACDGGKLPTFQYGKEISSNKYAVDSEFVLVSKLNPRFPRVWMPILYHSNRAIASTDFLTLKPKAPYSASFVYCLLSSTGFMERFASMVTGTSTSHQRVRPDDFLKMRILNYPKEITHQFTEMVHPILQLQHNNRLNSETLSETRDLLLPRLVSGQIDVSDSKTKILLDSHKTSKYSSQSTLDQ